MRKGGVEKNKVEELEQRIENVKEGTIEQSKQKVGKEVKLEEKVEKEIRIFKNRGDKEKEAEIVVEKETSNQEMENKKDKLEEAKKILLGAIVMEQILSLYMQNSQEITCDREVEIWPEAQSGDNAWDIGTAWDAARGYCLEENLDTAWEVAGGYCLEEDQYTAWDAQIGYCLEESQDTDWEKQLEMQA